MGSRCISQCGARKMISFPLTLRSIGTEVLGPILGDSLFFVGAFEEFSALTTVHFAFTTMLTVHPQTFRGCKLLHTIAFPAKTSKGQPTVLCYTATF
mmetsp:Transcript_7420/g.15127  ORF Transcript_7420/g.15127 Transcript_7420/m.15127 type:complete len:97 (-) Transcript_7420:206-496(-)